MLDGSNLIGKVLDTYILEELIGQGGMSTVYRAKQIHPARNVAVKVLQQPLKTPGESNRSFLSRFQLEADIVARLEHINIVPIYDYGEQDQLAYLVMPYISGGNLNQLLKRYGAFTLNQSLIYMQQAAAALDYAHAHNVIHRDLKPSNFLIYPDGRLVLADFGIARIVNRDRMMGTSALTLTGQVLGTPAYISPEMLRGEPVDFRTDIYSLGIVLFQMLTGIIPFENGNVFAIMNKHLHEPLPSLHAIDQSIPSTVDTVIQKATAKRKEDRYPSAGALVKALQGAIQSPDSSSYSIHQETPIPLSSPPPAPLTSTIAQKPIFIEQPGNQNRPDSLTLGVSEIQPLLSKRMPPLEQKNKRRPLSTFLKTLPIIALFIGGLLISLRVLGVFAGNTQTPPLTPTDQVKMMVQQYYDDINKGDYHAAYNLLSAKFQQSSTYGNFSSGYAQDKKDDIIFNKVIENSDGTVTVDATLLVLYKNNATKSFHWTAITIQQSPGNWKINQASLIQIQTPTP